MEIFAFLVDGLLLGCLWHRCMGLTLIWGRDGHHQPTHGPIIALGSSVCTSLHQPGDGSYLALLVVAQNRLLLACSSTVAIHRVINALTYQHF
jgi:branched-subunit amino acid ABC-type transport system permease component